jgi:hypothetical protein
MDKHDVHEKREAHKIGDELRHGDLGHARKELQHEARNPHEFKKIVDKVNKDLKAHHQHPLSVEHDKHGNISHLHFGAHDIFDKKHGGNQQHGKDTKESKESKNTKDTKERKAPIDSNNDGFLDPAQKAQLEKNKTDGLKSDYDTARAYKEGKPDISRKDLQDLLKPGGKMDPSGEPNANHKEEILKDRAKVQELEKQFDSPEARRMQSKNGSGEAFISAEKADAVSRKKQ